MKLRNVAIIAHVDHGKTTLVDRLLQQSGNLSREPGAWSSARWILKRSGKRGSAAITILAKAASVQWKDTRINIVDTPGPRRFRRRRVGAHPEHGGRGAGAGGTPPKVRCRKPSSWSSKALKVGLKPIVVINKVDRPRRAADRSDQRGVFEPVSPRSTPAKEQLDFPDFFMVRPSRAGWPQVRKAPRTPACSPLFDLILRHVAPPHVEDGPFPHDSAPFSRPTPISAASSPAASPPGSIKPNQGRQGCWAATAD